MDRPSPSSVRRGEFTEGHFSPFSQNFQSAAMTNQSAHRDTGSEAVPRKSPSSARKFPRSAVSASDFASACSADRFIGHHHQYHPEAWNDNCHARRQQAAALETMAAAPVAPYLSKSASESVRHCVLDDGSSRSADNLGRDTEFFGNITAISATTPMTGEGWPTGATPVKEPKGSSRKESGRRGSNRGLRGGRSLGKNPAYINQNNYKNNYHSVERTADPGATARGGRRLQPSGWQHAPPINSTISQTGIQEDAEQRARALHHSLAADAVRHRQEAVRFMAPAAAALSHSDAFLCSSLVPPPQTSDSYSTETTTETTASTGKESSWLPCTSSSSQRQHFDAHFPTTVCPSLDTTITCFDDTAAPTTECLQPPITGRCAPEAVIRTATCVHQSISSTLSPEPVPKVPSVSTAMKAAPSPSSASSFGPHLLTATVSSRFFVGGTRFLSSSSSESASDLVAGFKHAVDGSGNPPPQFAQLKVPGTGLLPAEYSQTSKRQDVRDAGGVHAASMKGGDGNHVPAFDLSSPSTLPFSSVQPMSQNGGRGGACTPPPPPLDDRLEWSPRMPGAPYVADSATAVDGIINDEKSKTVESSDISRQYQHPEKGNHHPSIEGTYLNGMPTSIDGDKNRVTGGIISNYNNNCCFSGVDRDVSRTVGDAAKSSGTVRQQQKQVQEFQQPAGKIAYRSTRAAAERQPHQQQSDLSGLQIHHHAHDQHRDPAAVARNSGDNFQQLNPSGEMHARHPTASHNHGPQQPGSAVARGGEMWRYLVDMGVAVDKRQPISQFMESSGTTSLTVHDEAARAFPSPLHRSAGCLPELSAERCIDSSSSSPFPSALHLRKISETHSPTTTSSNTAAHNIFSHIPHQFMNTPANEATNTQHRDAPPSQMDATFPMHALSPGGVIGGPSASSAVCPSIAQNFTTNALPGAASHFSGVCRLPVRHHATVFQDSNSSLNGTPVLHHHRHTAHLARMTESIPNAPARLSADSPTHRRALQYIVPIKSGNSFSLPPDPVQLSRSTTALPSFPSTTMTTNNILTSPIEAVAANNRCTTSAAEAETSLTPATVGSTPQLHITQQRSAGDGGIPRVGAAAARRSSCASAAVRLASASAMSVQVRAGQQLSRSFVSPAVLLSEGSPRTVGASPSASTEETQEQQQVGNSDQIAASLLLSSFSEEPFVSVMSPSGTPDVSQEPSDHSRCLRTAEGSCRTSTATPLVDEAPASPELMSVGGSSSWDSASQDIHISFGGAISAYLSPSATDSNDDALAATGATFASTSGSRRDSVSDKKLKSNQNNRGKSEVTEDPILSNSTNATRLMTDSPLCGGSDGQDQLSLTTPTTTTASGASAGSPFRNCESDGPPRDVGRRKNQAILSTSPSSSDISSPQFYEEVDSPRTAGELIAHLEAAARAANFPPPSSATESKKVNPSPPAASSESKLDDSRDNPTSANAPNLPVAVRYEVAVPVILGDDALMNAIGVAPADLVRFAEPSASWWWSTDKEEFFPQGSRDCDGGNPPIGQKTDSSDRGDIDHSANAITDFWTKQTTMRSRSSSGKRNYDDDDIFGQVIFSVVHSLYDDGIRPALTDMWHRLNEVISNPAAPHAIAEHLKGILGSPKTAKDYILRYCCSSDRFIVSDGSDGLGFSTEKPNRSSNSTKSSASVNGNARKASRSAGCPPSTSSTEIKAKLPGGAAEPAVFLRDPPANFAGWIDPRSPHSPFSLTTWRIFLSEVSNLLTTANYGKRTADATLGKWQFKGGRYGLAMELKSSSPHFAGQRLGRICHLVQLAIDCGVLSYEKSVLQPTAACMDRTRAFLRISPEVPSTGNSTRMSPVAVGSCDLFSPTSSSPLNPSASLRFTDQHQRGQASSPGHASSNGSEVSSSSLSFSPELAIFRDSARTSFATHDGGARGSPPSCATFVEDGIAHWPPPPPPKNKQCPTLTRIEDVVSHVTALLEKKEKTAGACELAEIARGLQQLNKVALHPASLGLSKMIDIFKLPEMSRKFRLFCTAKTKHKVIAQLRTRPMPVWAKPIEHDSKKTPSCIPPGAWDVMPLSSPPSNISYCFSSQMYCHDSIALHL